MKISEMEYHHGEYTSLEDKINKMLENREFPAIFSVCVETFPHIVPAIQYRKKREIEPEMPDWLAFKVICKYAPPLFEHSVMESLSEFVKSTRLLTKHENVYLKAIETAFKHEEITRSLWNHIEKQPNVLQRDICRYFDDNQKSVTSIIELWEKLGLVFHKNESSDLRLNLRTRLDEEVEGVCQNCGVHGKGHKEHFFKSISCQRCGTEGYYHIKYINP